MSSPRCVAYLSSDLISFFHLILAFFVGGLQKKSAMAFEEKKLVAYHEVKLSLVLSDVLSIHSVQFSEIIPYHNIT